MKLVVLYRPESEFSRAVETFVTDFNRLHEGIGRRVEVIPVDSRDGMSMMTLYDIMDHPALMVLSDSGQQLKYWSGMPLPLMDEVASYFYTAQTQ